MGLFVKNSIFSCSVNELFSWHERRGVILRLIPPWDNVEVIKKPENLYDSEAFLLLRIAPFVKFIWHAKHNGYQKNQYFKDIQISGPFRKWEHTHFFKAISENSAELTDRVEFEPIFKFFANMLAENTIYKKLASTFGYRHTVTGNDIDFLKRYPINTKCIAIAGSNGLIGHSLTGILKTHGHKIYKIVRYCTNKQDEIFFDQKNSTLCGDFEPPDIVVNLAGEPIGEGSWTDNKKAAFYKSRVDFSRSLLHACLKLDKKPSHFINASAIGFYGNSDNTLSEEYSHGDSFLSNLCVDWEEAVKNDFIKTSILRFGVVLSPRGGALRKLINLCRVNLGASLGKGNQYVSWITIDDAIYAILHIIYKELEGVFNLTTPNPITQKELVDKISRKLNRVRFLSLNEHVVKLIYGEMADDVLLANCHVIPKHLLDTGFKFYFPCIDEGLNHLLGINV